MCYMHIVDSEQRLVKSQKKCGIWGVLNVTPDSFSDGGKYAETDAAIDRGFLLSRQGAEVIDIGGQSTRPAGKTYGSGYAEVPPEFERDRVVPVIRALCEQGCVTSVDTNRGLVAEAAVLAGAKIINDVSAGADLTLLEVAAKYPVELVLMHNRGRGEVNELNARYEDVTQEVIDELAVAVERARHVGVDASRVWLDPGIGFAKTAEQSLTLLNSLEDLTACGYRVLVGASRKSFIAVASSRSAAPAQRLGGSLAVALHAKHAGVHAVRVHDVFETRQAFDIDDAIAGARSGG